MPWTYHATDQTPAATATVFAATQFDDVREIAECAGHWRGPTWHGTFRLVDGTRTYALTGYADGTWVVAEETEPHKS